MVIWTIFTTTYGKLISYTWSRLCPGLIPLEFLWVAVEQYHGGESTVYISGKTIDFQGSDTETKSFFNSLIIYNLAMITHISYGNMFALSLPKFIDNAPL